MKKRRQAKILEIISSDDVETQEELQENLLRICPQKDGMFIQLEKRTSKILLIAQAEYSTKA